MESILGPKKNKIMLLLDLREAKKMDPWAIDISESLREALESLRALERTNFALLGLLLFNSSVIYELKAESLLWSDAEEEDGPGLERPEGEPALFIPGQLRPKMDFLATVISALLSSVGRRGRTGGRSLKLSSFIELKPPPPPEPDFDMEEWMERVLAILRARGPALPLADVLAVFKRGDVLKAFLTLLHMAQEGLVRFSRIGDGRGTFLVILEDG